MANPPLRALHPDASLSPAKLADLRKRTTDDLLRSLAPGQMQPLRAKRDGTIMEGHHRIKVLRERGVDVDALPRVLVEADDS